MNLDDLIKKMDEYARNKGANSTKLISTKKIVVAEWVRLKCMYGCKGYDRHFTCPPYTPTPEETRKTLKDYKFALLVEFSGLKEKEEQQKIHDVIFELERMAFLEGYAKAFGMTAGPCRKCGKCIAEKESDKKFCPHQDKARPSMEACGIDVYSTVRNAGYEINVVKEKSSEFKSFGMILLK